MFVSSKHMIWVLMFFGLASVGFADSPLTSTDFHQAYLDVPVVSAHVDCRLDEEIYEILRSDEYGLDVKVAVINAMGWTFEGQDNAARYMEYYMEDASTDVIPPDSLSGEELLMLAYMVSMDDYFGMGAIEPGVPGVLGMSGVELAEVAADRAPDDFTVRLISALILSQEAMDHDWGQVFDVMDIVMQETLVRNMRKNAVEIIMDYIGLYSRY